MIATRTALQVKNFAKQYFKQQVMNGTFSTKLSVLEKILLERSCHDAIKEWDIKVAEDFHRINGAMALALKVCTENGSKSSVCARRRYSTCEVNGASVE